MTLQTDENRAYLSKARRCPSSRLLSRLLASTIVGSLALAAVPSLADEASDIQALKQENAALKARLDKMQKAIDALMSQQSAAGPAKGGSAQAAAQAAAVQAQAAAAEAAAAQAAAAQAAATQAAAQAAATQAAIQEAKAKDKPFLTRKGDQGLTFTTPGGEITAYGQLDVSIDEGTKGLEGKTAGGVPPVGRLGWQPDVSTNAAYIGVRGFQHLGDQPFDLVYQLETQIDISAASGTVETGSNQGNIVKDALTSRNSWIGIKNDGWGTIAFGKTNGPYEQSIGRMNPFSGQFGDMGVIMGNTGGDNRDEFNTRLDHSIWYESPSMSGFKLDLLYSPGQNRASNSDNIAAGESDCTGGNIPGSGGIFSTQGETSGAFVGDAFACNDGSWSDTISAAVLYEDGPLYVTAGYERHFKVNRQSDLTGIYVHVPPILYNQDVADEDAAHIGIQYAFATGTTVSGVFEDLHRYVPQDLMWQNERQRIGYWFALTQEVFGSDTFDIGWGHAGKTPGDPGQHNDSLTVPPLGNPATDATAGADVDNSANLVTVDYKHSLGDGLLVYGSWAAAINGPYAHYDLGDGARGVVIDCHDAFSASGGEFAVPHCWTGATLMGVSLGLRYRF